MKNLNNLKSFDEYFSKSILESLSEGNLELERKIVESEEWKDFTNELKNPDEKNTNGIINSYMGLICRCVGFTKRIWNVVNELVNGESKAAYKYFVNYLKGSKADHLELVFQASVYYVEKTGRAGDMFSEFIHKELKPLGFKEWCKINSPNAYKLIWENEEEFKAAEDEFGDDFFNYEKK